MRRRHKKNTSDFPFAILWGLLTGTLYFLFLRPQLLKWGTRLGESQRRLPGDDLIPNPNIQETHAVDIDAPPEAVWPWVAQMGRARTGWYTFDMLTNNGIPSATYLRHDLSAPRPGMQMDHGLKVMTVEENRLLIVGGYDLPDRLGTTLDLSLLYLLERKSDGSTRLLVRMRGYTYGILSAFSNLLLEVLVFALINSQLRGIKYRAETMAYLHMPVPREHEISLN